jgi:protein O-mannosyl-transferase
MRSLALFSGAPDRTSLMQNTLTKKNGPYALAAVVSLVTLTVYLSALRNEFVLWDDDANVYNNIHIRSLNLDFLRWAFSDVSLSLWQPVVWFSYAFDHVLWGLNPFGYHLTNILLHAANTFLAVNLVIRLLKQAGSRPLILMPAAGEGGGFSRFPNERAVLVAGGVAGLLFGLHPLHVESAAWVTGRTDLLCTFFFLLSVMTYLSYAAGRETTAGKGAGEFFRNRAYLLSLACGILALASKAMAVSLPVVLLILDWYPLNRIRSRKNCISAFVEKIPFIVLSFAATIAAIWGQKAAGDLQVVQNVSLSARVLAAAKALTLYLGKMVLPLHLSPFYPYPGTISFFSFEYGAALVLACMITAVSILLVKKHPVLPALWGAYLVTLLPVLGIVKVRSVSMADRYTYLPSLAPFLLLGLAAAWVWSRTDRMKQHGPLAKRVTAVLAVSLCGVLIALTLKQISVWKNSITLWSSVIEKAPGLVPTAYHNRGLAFKDRGLPERAIEDFNEVIKLDPKSPNNYNSRGLAYRELGQFNRALEDFTTAITRDPQFADAYTNRGWTFKQMGQRERAMQDYDRAIELNPARHIVYNNRGMAFQELGRFDLAIEDFTTALDLDPFYAEAYTNRGLAFEQSGRRDQAFEDYTSAIKADPSFANAYNNRGLLLEKAGRLEQALEDLTRAIRLNPSGVEAYSNRGLVYEDLGKFDLAVEDYSRAIDLQPDDYLAYSNRGIALAKRGLFERAVEDQTKAILLNPGFARAYLDRGDCYRAMGKPVDARKDYRRACDLGNNAGCEQLHR